MNDPVRLSLFWAAVLACTPLNAQNLDAVDHVTVPMSVEGNAPIVTLTFKKPDGSSRRARFVFDSGGGGIILNEGLAKDLGEKPIGPVMSSDGQRFQEVDVPAAWVGRMPIDLRGSRTFMHLGATSFTNRDTVEGLLPGKAFEHYQVVLDYPRQEWSVGEPGTLQHRGERIAAPYITSSGHYQHDTAQVGKCAADGARSWHGLWHLSQGRRLLARSAARGFLATHGGL